MVSLTALYQLCLVQSSIRNCSAFKLLDKYEPALTASSASNCALAVLHRLKDRSLNPGNRLGSASGCLYDQSKTGAIANGLNSESRCLQRIRKSGIRYWFAGHNNAVTGESHVHGRAPQ